VPRSATDLEGENYKLTANLPKISIRTILPVAQFVKAKLAIEEDQHELASGPGGNGKDIRKATDGSTSGAEAVETPTPPAAKSPRKTLGAAPEADAALSENNRGGAGC
jgi:hypothetical protein